MNREIIKCFIIGSGPAGYTAAIYASRANLSPVLYEGVQPGGQLTTTGTLENFPGFPEGIDGQQFMEDMRKQALRFGTDIQNGVVTSVDFSKSPYKITIDGEKDFYAHTVIISTGASAKYLGLEDEKKYAGMGVSACATCDGFFYRKKVVAVVGGGDTACEEATYLAGLASKVYLIVRKNYLRASQIMQERVLNHEKIEVLFEHNAEGLYGDNGVEGVHLVKHLGQPDETHYDLPIDGFFLAIGHKPNSDVFKQYLDTDPVGYILTEDGTPRTKIPGIFAAGDVADPHFRQAVTAAASGCKAAILSEKYLLENKLI
jgi:thioredoxin reductase (NADPH)